MSNETVLRWGAAAVAVFVVAAPHAKRLADWAKQVFAARPADAVRLSIAAVLLAAGWGASWLPKVDLPNWSVTPAVLLGLLRLATGCGAIGTAGFLWWRHRKDSPADDLRSAVHLLLVATGLLLLGGAPSLPLPTVSWPTLPSIPSIIEQATAAVYVYEKDDGPVPAEVSSGLDKLNRERKVLAVLFEDDTLDGDGQVPEQFKPALHAAKEAAIPSLVVLSGTSVIRVVRSPKTEAEIVGAVP